ncbi:MAG: hypothetical protein FWG35_08225 [Spirochaetaceae bacterium]|nr:hypothetical protein [Spirochaetaceae bacterium]
MMRVFVCFFAFALACCAGGPARQGEVPAPREEPPRAEALPGAPEEDLPLLASSLLPPAKKPVTQGGKPLAFVRGDMVVLLAVTTPNPRAATFASVSGFERLFDSSAQELAFSVEVFSRAADGKISVHSIDAGEHRVCSSFSLLPFPSAQGFPCGVSLIFPDTKGKRSFWVLFSGETAPQGSPQYSVFSFYEQANVRAFIQDIDGDGIFDLFLFEDIFEDSSGYETYITWHRWDGRSFVKYRSTNIVRRLRAFFESSRQMILARGWKRFFDYALLPEDSPDLQHVPAADAFRRIFSVQDAVPFGEENLYAALFSPAISRSGISNVVFPNVTENPFPRKDGEWGNFPFTIRISAGEEDYFFSARLALNKDPFSGRMFHFLPSE